MEDKTNICSTRPGGLESIHCLSDGWLRSVPMNKLLHSNYRKTLEMLLTLSQSSPLEALMMIFTKSSAESFHLCVTNLWKSLGEKIYGKVLEKKREGRWGVFSLFYSKSLAAPMAKNLPPMQVIPVQIAGLESSLEKKMAIHSSILAWRIPGIEEPGRL